MVIMDIVVIGGGHAGCEAALASARMGYKTLLIAKDLDRLGRMPCNPSIGGPGKTQLVREIDALGGAMASAADSSAVHVRLLNESRGPAVQSLRAQTDREEYSRQIRKHLDECPGIFLLQDTVTNIDTRHGRISSVKTRMGDTYPCRACVIAAGTFFRGRIFIGKNTFAGGRSTEQSSELLPECLENNGILFRRFKTGTPPRIDINSIDLPSLEIQIPQTSPDFFSHLKGKRLYRTDIPCYRVKSNSKTAEIINNNLSGSPLYAKDPEIQGPGPRYCPSIETKVIRFPEKPGHILFLEPEGVNTNETYLSGFSTSMPVKIQEQMVQSINGFENARLTRPGYAVEYDVFSPGQLKSNLEFKTISGLFSAGQINGTSGYEEAASQGLVAGINAALSIAEEPPFIPDPLQSYTGSLIQLVTTMDIFEPVRMFTSLVSRRLAVRNDNADLRMCELVDPRVKSALLNKTRALEYEKRKKYYNLCLHDLKNTRSSVMKICKTIQENTGSLSPALKAVFDNGDKQKDKAFTAGKSVWDIIKQPDIDASDISSFFPKSLEQAPDSLLKTLTLDSTYERFIELQDRKLNMKKGFATADYEFFSGLLKSLDFRSVPNLPRSATAILQENPPSSFIECEKLVGANSEAMRVITAHIISLVRNSNNAPSGISND